MKQYHDLLRSILDHGVEHQDRTGIARGAELFKGTHARQLARCRARRRLGLSARVAGVSEWFEELSALLRIPSVSADPAHAGDVREAGAWVCELLRSAEGAAELVDWHGQPLAVGELRASREPDRAPTILCYGHFDVQPPDPLELWESAPFEPEIRGEHVYGRGVADDKGQLYLLLAAARELAEGGELPVKLPHGDLPPATRIPPTTGHIVPTER